MLSFNCNHFVLQLCDCLLGHASFHPAKGRSTKEGMVGGGRESSDPCDIEQVCFLLFYSETSVPLCRYPRVCFVLLELFKNAVRLRSQGD